MDNIKTKLWNRTLDELEKKLSPQHFKTWIKPISFENLINDTVEISVPNKFIQDWIKNNYIDLIKEIISDLSAVDYNINLFVSNSNKNIDSKNVKEEIEIKNVVKTKKWETSYNLNIKYTFDDFVQGSSNQFSFAAAKAVAENPATTYNPLFIYGGVGLGKTHLLHAIGNEIAKTKNSMRVCYYASEKFMNELINSIRYGKMDDFRNKFRSMDVLLIDDVQFIAGKERTQEEFFHTFNALYDSHKQIVVTSDKFPKEIPGLEERLRSRFEWGLIADIQSPDIETKQAILKMKAEQNCIELPEDISLYLASSLNSNIRDLEGYLIRIGAYASLTSTPINLSMAKEVLKNIIPERNKELSVEEIQKFVCNHFNIKLTEIKSSKRSKNLVLPRQIAMYLSRNLTDCSLPLIGEKFGGKDHSTIIHAVKKIEKMIEEDPNMNKILINFKEMLSN